MTSIARKEMQRNLLKEQGFEEDVVKSMSTSDLSELWNHYHEN